MKEEFYLNPKSPKGICCLCIKECDPEGIIHYSCGIAYTDEKQRRARMAEK